jgi:hypothetical protein
LINAQTPLARQGRAVGLVIAGLENVLRSGGGAGLFHFARDHLCVVFAFELAGAGDHGQGAIIADNHVTDGYLGHEVTCSLRMEAVRDNIR